MRRWWPFLLAAVPLSSVLGMVTLMRRDGAGAFVDVWAASLWADLLFVAGTVGGVWLGAYLACRGRPTGIKFTGAVGASFVVHTLVYMLAWSLAEDAHAGQGPGFFGLAFGLQNPLDVLMAGIVGIAAMSFMGPLLGLFLPPRGEPKAGDEAYPAA